MITATLLRQIMPYAGERASLFAGPLDRARIKWLGNDDTVTAHFLAQIAHESGELKYVRELASGEAYEGRKDLGNMQPGDGARFRGRGLIQLTGRANYTDYARDSGTDVVNHPELLESPELAADVSGWFWAKHNLSLLTDVGDPVLAITKVINGGTNGLDSRRLYYARAVESIRNLAAEPTDREAEEPTRPPVLEKPTQPAPIEESTPTIYRPRPVEKRMIPALVASLIPSLIQALPEIAKIFKGDNMAERNVALATKAFELIGPAINAQNEQETVQKLLDSPEAVAIAREAIRPMIEVIEVGEGGIGAARKFLTDVTMGPAPDYLKITFTIMIGVLAFAIVVGGGWIMREMLLNEFTDVQVKGSILDYMKNMGLIVAGFIFGSSVGSRRKDEVR